MGCLLLILMGLLLIVFGNQQPTMEVLAVVAIAYVAGLTDAS